MKSLIGTRIGILGGGQLGRMFIQNALNYGVEINVLDDDPNCPCASIATNFILGSLYDEAKINELAAISDVLTFEIEHLDAHVLHNLEQNGKKIFPTSKVLKIIQNKGIQKQFYENNLIPTASFIIVDSNDIFENKSFIDALLDEDNLVVKALTGGYDGKGVYIAKKSVIRDKGVIFEGDVLIEKFIPDAKEIAIIIARDGLGNIVAYEPIEMVFCPETNLVTHLFSPANIENVIAEEAEKIARKTIEKLGGIGVFAVEMFVDSNNIIFVNEVAPRTHNSGHHTIEGFATSQYDQLLRILVDLPLGSTKLLAPCAMINLVGAHQGDYKLDNIAQILGEEGVYLHLYGKKISKPGRKLGHITIVKQDIVQLQNTLKKILPLAKIIP
jgi:5-(carboxyamino)imidazole ribonucleotide synthase